MTSHEKVIRVFDAVLDHVRQYLQCLFIHKGIGIPPDGMHRTRRSRWFKRHHPDRRGDEEKKIEGTIGASNPPGDARTERITTEQRSYRVVGRGQPGEDGCQVIRLSGPAAVGTHAASDTPEVEPNHVDAFVQGNGCGDVQHAVVHAAAIERMGMTHHRPGVAGVVRLIHHDFKLAGRSFDVEIVLHRLMVTPEYPRVRVTNRRRLKRERNTP